MRNSVLLGSVILLAAGTVVIESGRAEPVDRGSSSVQRSEPSSSSTEPAATRTEPAAAANQQLGGTRADDAQATVGEHSGSTMNSAKSGDAAADAQRHVDAAVQAVNRMKSDPKLTELLQRAKGVFIVPNYGKAAVVVGGRGGEGVLLVRNEEKWSDPAFFTLGGVTVGAQAGVAGGPIAMLLMSDKAVQQFKTQENSFSLNANAGLTIVNYSADAHASTHAGARMGDVVVWSATKGLFAGAALGVSDIRRDAQQNSAYYSRTATPQQIFGGVVSSPNADALREALPNRVASTD